MRDIMENLRIATWNIKNSYFNIQKNEIKAASVIQLLKNENLDILTLQEVNPLLARKIEEKLRKLDKEYQITSNYEKTSNPIKNLRIEHNVIISRLEPISSSHIVPLSYKPKGFAFVKNIASIRKRDVTYQCLHTPDSLPDVLVEVTHLDHAVEELGKRQMGELAKLTSYHNSFEDYDTILTGNLNRKPLEQNMMDFTKQLSDIGMKVIENPHKTYVGHTDEQPVDYIIVPEPWEVESLKTLEDYDDISSHRPVVVETRKR